MRYLHTMVRVGDLEKSLHFYCDLLGLHEVRRVDNEKGRFTLVFLAAQGDDDAQIELTHNWDPEQYGIGRAFGHLAYQVDDIYAACARLQAGGVTINNSGRILGNVRLNASGDLQILNVGNTGAGGTANPAIAPTVVTAGQPQWK